MSTLISMRAQYLVRIKNAPIGLEHIENIYDFRHRIRTLRRTIKKQISVCASRLNPGSREDLTKFIVGIEPFDNYL
jgi:hypothetical protein